MSRLSDIIFLFMLYFTTQTVKNAIFNDYVNLPKKIDFSLQCSEILLTKHNGNQYFTNIFPQLKDICAQIEWYLHLCSFTMLLLVWINFYWLLHFKKMLLSWKITSSFVLFPHCYASIIRLHTHVLAHAFTKKLFVQIRRYKHILTLLWNCKRVFACYHDFSYFLQCKK